MNKITISGIMSEHRPVFSHEVNGEKFYSFTMMSARRSGCVDAIPCVIPEHIMQNIPYERFAILGEIRTKNYTGQDDKRHLSVFVFVKEILQAANSNENEVELDGFICKPPIYRETPQGKQITDLVIASNRTHGKSDYIPTIAWGGLAMKSSQMPVGTEVTVKGRLQSRKYLKQYGDGVCEDKIAYELSVYQIFEKEESEE